MKEEVEEEGGQDRALICIECTGHIIPHHLPIHPIWHSIRNARGCTSSQAEVGDL